MSDTDRMIHISIEGTSLQFSAKALAESSDYFGAMLNGQFKESSQDVIKLEDVDLDVFQMFHEWVHGVRKRFTDLEMKGLLQLLIFADRFIIDKMKEQIYEKIYSQLNLQRQEEAYELLETSVLIGDLMLKDVFMKWLKEKLALPSTCQHNETIDCIKRFFVWKVDVDNADLTIEVALEINDCLQQLHQKMMTLFATYNEKEEKSIYCSTTNYKTTNNKRIDEMLPYLETLFKVKKEQEVEKNNVISVNEHQILHEWMFDLRHDFSDQVIAMQLRLMTIAKRFEFTQLSAALCRTVLYNALKQTEPSAILYASVETYLIYGDLELKKSFSHWVVAEFQDYVRINLNQLLQSTLKLMSWQYDIQINKFDLTERALKEVDGIFKTERDWMDSFYRILMGKSNQRDLEEGISQFEQLEEELKDCTENLREFKIFVSKKRQQYEKELQRIVNPIYSSLTNYFKSLFCLSKGE